MKKNVFFFALFINIFHSNAQIGVNTTTPQGAFDVEATTMGMVIPRVPDYTQVTTPDGSPPVDGTLVYDTTLQQMMFRVNESWITLGIAASGSEVETGILEDPFIFNNTQVGQDINGENSNDNSGASVDISYDGNIIAVSAQNNDGNGFDSGHVRVFENLSGIWTQIGQDIDGESANDRSGNSIALSSDGNVIAIGAILNSGAGFQYGHVRVYENNSGSWLLKGQEINGVAQADLSGIVALSDNGNILAIGSPGNDGNGLDSGHVRVFEYVSGTWSQIGQDINGEFAGDRSGGVALSSSGEILAVSSILNDGNGTNSGHVRVYENLNGTWTQIGQDIDGESSNDLFGLSLALSANGGILAVGAPENKGDDSNSSTARAGHVRVFEFQSGSWIQIGQDINGENPFDESGSVDISDDGKILAIGASENDGNGISSGHVRIYQLQSGVWTQSGTDIDGAAQFDGFGGSVAISGDGKTVVSGARGNDGNGSASGHVRVFQ